MTGVKILLVVLFLLVILFPVVKKVLSDVDYKRQLRGNRPERQSSDSCVAYSSAEMDQQKEHKEMLDTEARVRSMQNFIGPK